jgi:hypothetical protein
MLSGDEQTANPCYWYSLSYSERSLEGTSTENEPQQCTHLILTLALSYTALFPRFIAIVSGELERR